MEAVDCASLLPLEGVSRENSYCEFRLIDLDRCIAIAGISESTYYRLVKQGLMPRPAKIGRANRWVESEVVAAYQRLAQGGA